MSKVIFTRWALNAQDRKQVSVNPDRVDIVEGFGDAYGGEQYRVQVELWHGEPGHTEVPACTRIIMQGKQEYLVQGTLEEVTRALHPNARPIHVLVPTVHLNGTSKDELMLQLRTAIDALYAAAGALAVAAPHGRDYYPQGVDVIQRAIEQHRDRLSKIAGVAAELEGIAEKVIDA